jgi:hypothetical protein
MMIRYSQRDPRWANDTLGMGIPNVDTLGRYGCTVTALSQMLFEMGFLVTPASLNKQLQNWGAGAFANKTFVSFVTVAKLYNISLTHYVMCESTPAPLHDLNQWLGAGDKAIIKIDRSPAPGNQDHWLYIHQYDNEDYIVDDPWPLPETEGTGYLHGMYSFEPLNELITKIVTFAKSPDWR